MKRKFYFEGRKLEVFAPEQRLQTFSIGQIFSSETFPLREYFSEEEVVEKKGWVLKALHANEHQKIAVFVWDAKN